MVYRTIFVLTALILNYPNCDLLTDFCVCLVIKSSVRLLWNKIYAIIRIIMPKGKIWNSCGAKLDKIVYSSHALGKTVAFQYSYQAGNRMFLISVNHSKYDGRKVYLA